MHYQRTAVILFPWSYSSTSQKGVGWDSILLVITIDMIDDCLCPLGVALCWTSGVHRKYTIGLTRQRWRWCFIDSIKIVSVQAGIEENVCLHRLSIGWIDELSLRIDAFLLESLYNNLFDLWLMGFVKIRYFIGYENMAFFILSWSPIDFHCQNVAYRLSKASELPVNTVNCIYIALILFTKPSLFLSAPDRIMKVAIRTYWPSWFFKFNCTLCSDLFIYSH